MQLILFFLYAWVCKFFPSSCILFLLWDRLSVGYVCFLLSLSFVLLIVKVNSFQDERLGNGCSRSLGLTLKFTVLRR